MKTQTTEEIIPGATKTRRTVVETEVTKRDEVLIHYGTDVGWRPQPLSPKHKGEHIVERWVPVSRLRGRKGKRYYRIVWGHGQRSDIPVDG